MAKKDAVSERSKGTDDEIYKGDEDGSPVNGPRESGGGAGETTRLKGKNGRTTDNMGRAPYVGGADAGKGNTNQDDAGSARLYSSPSMGGGVGDEHQESAADEDVDDYYRSLSARRPPNYSKMPNLQANQAPLDQTPSEGGDGFVGSDTGPAVKFSYISGKKGYSEDVPIWSEKSSGGSQKTGADTGAPGLDRPQGQDSRDEYAPWKYVQHDEGLPQTHRNSFGAGDAGPASSDEPDESGVFGRQGGKGDTSYRTDQNVQDIPGAESGDTDTDGLPQTIITSVDGGGAPIFKFSGNGRQEKPQE